MGNCPSEFVVSPVGFGQCVAPCPADKGYELVGNANGALCQYTADSTFNVKLLPVPAIQLQPGQAPPSYKTLPNANIYETELKRAHGALAVMYGKIDAKTKVNAAFAKLQDAENVRDESPESYNAARVGYYTLIKGDTWINQEKARIAKTEAQPVIDNYNASYKDMNAQANQQKATIDVVNGVKDKLLTVQDDMAYSVNAFSKQIADIKNKINIDRQHRKQVEENSNNSWIDIFLNILIALTTISAIFIVARKLMHKDTPIQTPSSFQPVR